MTELQKNTKANIFDILETLESREFQIKYKKAVPFIHVPEELITEWDSSHIKNKKWYHEIWTGKQFITLSEFDLELKTILKSLPNNLPDTPEILENQLWIEIMSLASLTLEKLKLNE